MGLAWMLMGWAPRAWNGWMSGWSPSPPEGGRLGRHGRPKLLHGPAVADDDGLACEGVAGKAREEDRAAGDVIQRGELAVDRLLQHDRPDAFVLADPERLRLLGDLLVDQGGAHE